MEPLTIASCLVALTGFGAALRMRSRARRAEAEADTLRNVLLYQPAWRVSVPNQRPWRIAQPGPRQWVNSSVRPRANIPSQRRPIDPSPRPGAGGT